MKIKSKLLIFVFSTIVIVAVSILSKSIWALNDSTQHHIDYYTKSAHLNKEISLKNNVSMAKSIIKSYYDKIEYDGLTEDEAKKGALNYIKSMRYGEGNYYWVKDLDTKMIMHPISTSLNGTDVSSVQDTNGKYIFQEMVKLSKENGNGLVEYYWDKPGESTPQPKYSYVELFKPWGWVIGTGSYLNDVEDSVALMEKTSHDNLETIIWNTVFLVIIITIILSLLSSYLIGKIIIKPLSTLTGTVKALTKFSSADQKINIHTKDEIGDLAKYFNEYLESIRRVVAQDQTIVEESEKAIEMVRAGFFTYKVESSSTNRSTNDLKIAINDLIDDLNFKFTEVNKCILEYGKSNFEYNFNVDKVAGKMGTLVMGTQSIGNNVSELLATIMQSGESLSSNIGTLTDSAKSLSDSSNKQAVSLEETAASVEEITMNIKNSSSNIAKMKEIDDVVMNSATSGQELAHQTVSSMEEINKEVTSIADAITVIDQISFQTNILSLNAAVEAATAGEAGKGFAVVAQEVRNLASRSAEAARKIKLIVESATSKANEGKVIADKMIVGYDQLQVAIAQTKEIIDDVSNASREQEKGILQINDAVSVLDKNTQENASDATKIAELAEDVRILSSNLIAVANNAKFNANAKKQIGDIDLVNHINDLKLQYILFKDGAFEKLNDGSISSVSDFDLSRWIAQCESDQEPFTTTTNWKKIKDTHAKVSKSVNKYLQENHDKASNETLIEIGQSIELTTAKIFEALDKVKIEKFN